MWSGLDDNEREPWSPTTGAQLCLNDPSIDVYVSSSLEREREREREPNEWSDGRLGRSIALVFLLFSQAIVGELTWRTQHGISLRRLDYTSPFFKRLIMKLNNRGIDMLLDVSWE